MCLQSAYYLTERLALRSYDTRNPKTQNSRTCPELLAEEYKLVIPVVNRALRCATVQFGPFSLKCTSLWARLAKACHKEEPQKAALVWSWVAWNYYNYFGPAYAEEQWDILLERVGWNEERYRQQAQA